MSVSLLGCTGSDAATDDAASSATTIVESADGDDPFTPAESDDESGDGGRGEGGAADAASDDADGDDGFDPENAVDEPVEGDFDLDIDDDVIIGTDDGEIPAPTTEPPLPEDSPDAPPAVDVTTTTTPPVPVPEPAEIGRIVSLAPTHTETLFALGLGEFVVAVDSDSDFPDDAEAVRRSDLFADTSDLSVVLSIDPDVVIVGADPTGIAGRLAAEGVAVFSGPPAGSLAEVYDQIEGIAELVGRPDLAEDLIGRMRADIAEIVAALPAGERTFFHEIDPSLNAAASDSFLSSVYGELGLVNIAGSAGPGGTAQLTPDAVLAADPDVIVLGDTECCGVTADQLATRAGWSQLSALRDGAVVSVPDDLTSRWGPRVVELLRLVAGGVAAAG